MTGAGDAAAKVSRWAPWSAGSRTCRWAGGPPSCRSRSAATGARGAATWRQDTTAAAEPRAKLSRAGLRWALEGIVVQHLTMARVAEGLAVSWNTANDAVLTEGKRVLINDPQRLDGVTTIGVDEHVWRHTRRGDKYVTVIIDLTRSGEHRPGAVVGHGRGPLETGVQTVAGRPRQHLARPRRRRRDGRVHRLQDRRERRTP